VLCFFKYILVSLMLRKALKGIDEVQSGIPKHKFAMCCTEIIHVLDKFHLCMSYSSVGWKFNVNESTVFIQ
jgi:hypothetical protein